jgi:phosphatidylglycerophosphate synthase
VQLKCALVTDGRQTPHEWRRLLGVTVTGLPLLTRQLRCLRAAGFDQVTLVGPGWREIDVTGVPGLSVERGPDRVESLPEAWRWLRLPASLVLDVRLLRELAAQAAAQPGPIEIVDRFEDNPLPAVKSPFLVGTPNARELRPPDEAAGERSPIGLSVTGAAGMSVLRLAAGRYSWFRVRNRREAHAATWAMLLATMKRDDGFYSRWNRRLSLRVSRVLVGTRLTPNAATTLNGVLCLLAGWVMAQGTWGFGVAGAGLFLFTCIFDGVDGELARARFETSSLGEHLDAVEGAVFYVALVAGLGAAVQVIHPGWFVPQLTLAAVVSVAFWSVTTMVVSQQAVQRQTKSDRLYHVKMQEEAVGPVRALLRTCSFAFKRAAAGWYLLAFALAGGLSYIFVPVILGALLSAPIGIYVAALVVRDLRAKPAGQKA